MEENKTGQAEGAEPQQEKKKPLSAMLFGRAGSGKGGWGAVLGQLMASKTGIVAAALGITALAGMATLYTPSKGGASDGSGAALAFRPYDKYRPGPVAGDSGFSSLPMSFSEGSKPYIDELYRASVSPDQTYEEVASETQAHAAVEAATKALKGAGGGFGGGGGGGGGGAMASSRGRAEEAGKNAADARGPVNNMGRTAALGGGRSGTSVDGQSRAARSRFKSGMTRNPAGPVGQAYDSSIEAAKQRMDAKFDGTPVNSGALTLGETGGAADMGAPSTSFDAEVPKNDDGGGGGGGAPPTSSAATGGGGADQQGSEQLKKMVRDADLLMQDLAKLAEDNAQLCGEDKVNDAAEKIYAKGNEILAQLSSLEESGYYTYAQLNQWKCGVVGKMLKSVDDLVNAVKPYCNSYVAMKRACDNPSSESEEDKCLTKSDKFEAKGPAFATALAKFNEFELRMRTDAGIDQLVKEGSTGECQFDSQYEPIEITGL